MTYYHASPTGGLQILEPRISPFFEKPAQVCLTSLRAMALFYLIRNYEYAYGYTRQGTLYFDEPFPDALKKLYAGKSGWLYSCEEGNYERTKIPNEFVSAQPVRVTGAAYIPDAYEAFLQEQEAGNILLLAYAHSAADTKKFAEKLTWIEKEISEEILHNKLWKEPDCDRARYYRENYPEIWAHTLEQMQMEEKAIFHGKSEN